MKKCIELRKYNLVNTTSAQRREPEPLSRSPYSQTGFSVQYSYMYTMYTCMNTSCVCILHNVYLCATTDLSINKAYRVPILYLYCVLQGDVYTLQYYIILCRIYIYIYIYTHTKVTHMSSQKHIIILIMK